MATTFAIVAVFVPIAFMKGIIGRFFLQFGITVAVAVLVSLFVSFTLDPMLSSVWPDPAKDRFKYVPWLGRLMARIEHGIEWLHRVYAKVLALALDWRKSTLLLAVALFAGSLLLVPKIGGEFVPQVDDGFIQLRLKTPIGSSLEYSDAKLHQAEAALAEFKEIESVSTIVGSWEGRNYSQVNLKLTDVHKTHRRSQQEMEKVIRARHLADGRPAPDLHRHPRQRRNEARPGGAYADGQDAQDPRRGRHRIQPGRREPGHHRENQPRTGVRPRAHRAADRHGAASVRRRRPDEPLARAGRPEL
jgi:multidrug efflux pump subunit AcrB